MVPVKMAAAEMSGICYKIAKSKLGSGNVLSRLVTVRSGERTMCKDNVPVTGSRTATCNVSVEGSVGKHRDITSLSRHQRIIR